ncbi:hypothetical protein HN419_02450 [Candidatus Woesearchaeota archaeon]|jgi:hypothetical protein|nr:hypothetical protein [Candidatus Woesearchaeota archaeon]MBT3537143.1 hypothetical protein [Candidatus Woesearchaeota archaeon]MBT4697730.1 hypothetical protein [Candidatus Woesearchaeota archaeon]MBT4716566.1 hypothetical protein [Candidatus Woesearchaeota archaeon]MBT7106547.1 hypothetical protein [Candidatus Woesearchaeota archaeon]
MKITIDTQADSHDHIKKTIGFLQTIVGHNVVSNAPEQVHSYSPPPVTPSVQREAPRQESYNHMDILSAPREEPKPETRPHTYSTNPMDFPEVRQATQTTTSTPSNNVMSMFDAPTQSTPAQPATQAPGTVFDIFNTEKSTENTSDNLTRQEDKPAPVRIIHY